MRYVIEYKDDRTEFIDGSVNLKKALRRCRDPDEVMDIRQIRKSGNSQTVFDIYRKYLGRR